MYNAPYQGVANDLAKYGRYGDSMLVHMNPIEVQMLASLSPTGRLTDNPMTGQKEAFLPFLAPLLGSFLGKAALGTTLGTALGSKALGAAAAGALGSAAATTAVTGDLEQGIMSGITGFGLGTALGNLSSLKDVVPEAATATTTAAAPVANLTTQLQDLAPTVGEGFGTSVSSATEMIAPTIPTAVPQMPGVGEGFGAAMSEGAFSPAGRVMPTEPTFGQQFAEPFQRPGEFFSQLAQPGSFLPMYVGETGRMAREQELMGRGSMAAYEEEQEAQRQKTLRQMGDVFNQVRAAYPGVGYAQGGMVERYAVGGGVENAIRQAAERAGYGGEYGNFSGSLPYNIPDPKSVQLSLRGSQFVPPPASSYSALDVGGEGYLAGMAPEFQYFREPPPPPTGYVPPAPGTIAGGGGGAAPGDGGGGAGDINIMGGTGGFDFGNFLSGFRGLQNIYGRPGAGVGTGQPAGREPVGTGVIEPTGPEDLTMYPGGSATFNEAAGAGAGIPAGGEFDTSILQDLLNQQPTTPIGAPPIAQPETPAFTQPQLPPFMGINIADLEQRLAELNLSQETPISAENNTQYDPNRGRQVFETPQITFDNEPVYTQPDVPVGRPAMSFTPPTFQEQPFVPPPVAREPEPVVERETSRGIGAFRAPVETPYTPPEVYRSPQPVQMEPAPVYQPPAPPPPVVRQPQPVFEPPITRAPEPVVQAPPVMEPPPPPRFEPPVAQAPVPQRPVAPPVLRQPEPVFQPPSAVAPPPVAPPPVAVPSFDPQLLEQLIAMSRSPEAAPQQDRGFGGTSNFDNPFGEFGSSDAFAEGGMVNGTDNAMGEENSIVDMTVAAIRGEVENADQIIRRFVEMYGPEVFMQLREQVLQDIVPGAQTSGMVEGEGGGQDDMVEGMIGTQRPVAVSPGEYIIPADVVSLAGGGYSGDGAKYFDGLIDDIRQKTMGTTEQVKPYR